MFGTGQLVEYKYKIVHNEYVLRSVSSSQRMCEPCKCTIIYCLLLLTSSKFRGSAVFENCKSLLGEGPH